MIIVVLGAFLTTQQYIKRAIQGRWKSTVDTMGEQYDPQKADTFLTQTMHANSSTSIMTFNDANGYWTTRVDTTNSIENKTGYTGVEGY